MYVVSSIGSLFKLKSHLDFVSLLRSSVKFCCKMLREIFCIFFVINTLSLFAVGVESLEQDETKLIHQIISELYELK